MPRRDAAKGSLSTVFHYLKGAAALGIGSAGAQIAQLNARRPSPPARASSARKPGANTSWNAFAWWAILREAASGWTRHGVSTLGAAIAYYSLFSIGPLILIVITVAGLVFGEEAVRGQVSRQLADLLGQQGAKGVEDMLAVAGRPAEGVFAMLLSAGTLIFAAIGVVVQLKSALNRVWDVDTRSSGGIWSFVRTYAVSLAGVVSLGFLLLISLLLTTALSAAGTMLAGALPELALQAASFVVSLAMTSLLFAMMFKWLPDKSIGWREVLPGSLLTALLFELGKFLIGLYIGKQGLESTYGAAASLVVVLVWVYYSAQIVLFGAEFTRAYAERLTGPGGAEPAKPAKS